MKKLDKLVDTHQKFGFIHNGDSYIKVLIGVAQEVGCDFKIVPEEYIGGIKGSHGFYVDKNHLKRFTNALGIDSYNSYRPLERRLAQKRNLLSKTNK